MQLYFIRHGQSENNDLWERTGSNQGRSEDPELTTAGYQQARLLADFIQRLDGAVKVVDQYAPEGQQNFIGEQRKDRRDYFGFTHLYSSLMVRSIATGQPLSEVTGLPLHGWLDLHETGGIFLEDESNGTREGLPGRSRSYLSHNYQHLVLPDDAAESGWWNRGFEMDEERPVRAQRVFAELLARHGNSQDRVAMVSHGAFYNHLMHAIFGSNNKTSWFVMHNTGITRVDFSETNQPNLIYHNRTDHLPERLVT